jgi:SAM-dependent methyltransferase
MTSVQEHYDTHLAPHYAWIHGGADAARERSAALFHELGLTPSQPGATALDLGAGNGFQSLPLAAAGFAVTAVDLSAVLLAELSRDAADAGRSIRAVEGDLRALARFAPAPAPEAIVCMGDTLTHLPSVGDVTAVLRDAAALLAPGGHLVVSFRDYTTARTGPDRFIPVRSEPDRIFTCFLDYGPTHVAVHDVVHTRAGDAWRMTVSAYEKLRLDPAPIRSLLLSAGLTLMRDTTHHGMILLAARRPA